MRPPLVPLATTLGLVAGCGAARVISRTDTGGVLVLDGLRERAREDADRQMTEHCQGPYTIVRESDEAAGPVAEFRVQYVCGEVPGIPSSQYAWPLDVLEGIPDTSDISLH